MAYYLQRSLVFYFCFKHQQSFKYYELIMYSFLFSLLKSFACWSYCYPLSMLFICLFLPICYVIIFIFLFLLIRLLRFFLTLLHLSLSCTHPYKWYCLVCQTFLWAWIGAIELPSFHCIIMRQSAIFFWICKTPLLSSTSKVSAKTSLSFIQQKWCGSVLKHTFHVLYYLFVLTWCFAP